MITVNRETLCKAFFREWEISTTTDDFPPELDTLINLVNYSLKDAGRLEDLPDYDLRDLILSQETLFDITYEQDVKGNALGKRNRPTCMARK